MGSVHPVEEDPAWERRSEQERVVGAQPTSTEVEADPDEPAPESLGIPKPRHAQEGCHGCVLYDLIDSSTPFQRSAADGREHGPMLLEQPTEGLAVATPRPLHEFTYTVAAVEDLHRHPNSRMGAPPGYPKTRRSGTRLVKRTSHTDALPMPSSWWRTTSPCSSRALRAIGHPVQRPAHRIGRVPHPLTRLIDREKRCSSTSFT